MAGTIDGVQRALSSMRGRIVLAAVLATTLAVVLAGALVLEGASRDERAALDRRVERRAELLARPATIRLMESQRAPILGGVAVTFLAVNDLGLRLVENGQVARVLGEAPPATAATVPPGRVQTVADGATRWRVASADVPGRPGVRIEVAGPLEPVQATLQRLRRRIVIVGIASLLLAAALAALASNRAVAALGRLRGAAGEVADTSHLDRRVPAGGPTEVDELADAINALLARLERSSAERERAYEATRRFAADAGHELRTPLAVLGATLDTLDRNPNLPAAERADVVRDALAEQQRLADLVEALQALTRGDAGALGDERLVDLAEAVHVAIAAAERAGGLVVTTAIEAGTHTACASPTGVRLLLDNLLRNAALHARGDRDVARVAIGLALDDDGGMLLTVDDDGPGIPAESRAAVLGRFVRGAAPAGDGSGLGLALVDQQVRLAGGSLELGDAPLGGLRVALRFPPPPERPDA